MFQNKQLFVFKNSSELIYLTFATLLFSIPIFISNQFITGTLVNALLILGALNYSYKKASLLCFLPSTGVFLTGFLFGVLNPFLFYVLPFIWISNLILVTFVKKLNWNYFTKTIIGALIKSAFLFTVAFTLFSFGFVPQPFLIVFGPFQLITALIGLILAKIILSKIQH